MSSGKKKRRTDGIRLPCKSFEPPSTINQATKRKLEAHDAFITSMNKLLRAQEERSKALRESIQKVEDRVEVVNLVDEYVRVQVDDLQKDVKEKFDDLLRKEEATEERIHSVETILNSVNPEKNVIEQLTRQVQSIQVDVKRRESKFQEQDEAMRLLRQEYESTIQSLRKEHTNELNTVLKEQQEDRAKYDKAVVDMAKLQGQVQELMCEKETHTTEQVRQQPVASIKASTEGFVTQIEFEGLRNQITRAVREGGQTKLDVAKIYKNLRALKEAIDKLNNLVKGTESTSFPSLMENLNKTMTKQMKGVHDTVESVKLNVNNVMPSVEDKIKTLEQKLHGELDKEREQGRKTGRDVHDIQHDLRALEHSVQSVTYTIYGLKSRVDRADAGYHRSGNSRHHYSHNTRRRHSHSRSRSPSRSDLRRHRPYDEPQPSHSATSSHSNSFQEAFDNSTRRQDPYPPQNKYYYVHRYAGRYDSGSSVAVSSEARTMDSGMSDRHRDTDENASYNSEIGRDGSAQGDGDRSSHCRTSHSSNSSVDAASAPPSNLENAHSDLPSNSFHASSHQSLGEADEEQKETDVAMEEHGSEEGEVEEPAEAADTSAEQGPPEEPSSEAMEIENTPSPSPDLNAQNIIEIESDDDMSDGQPLQPFTTETIQGDSSQDVADPNQPPDTSNWLRLMTENELKFAMKLYLVLTGAPSLDFDVSAHVQQLPPADIATADEISQIQRSHHDLTRYHHSLSQMSVQAIRFRDTRRSVSSSRTLSGEDVTMDKLSETFSLVCKQQRYEWGKIWVDVWSKRLSGDLRVFLPPALETLDEPIERDLKVWKEAQEKCNRRVLRSVLSDHGLNDQWQRLQKKYTDVPAATSLFLTLFAAEEMFDTNGESTRSSKRICFCLRDRERFQFVLMWKDVVVGFPSYYLMKYVWLGIYRKTVKRIPVLGFCHMLATLLAINSLDRREDLNDTNMYYQLVEKLLQHLWVNRQSVANHPCTEIQLIGQNASTIEFQFDEDPVDGLLQLGDVHTVGKIMCGIST